MGQAVEVAEFARVFVKEASQLPAGTNNHYEQDTDRYYFKLDFSSLEKADTPLTKVLSELRKGYDVEIVHRIETDQIVKERRYVESPDDVPDGYKVEQGSQGGTYYETNPTNAPQTALHPTDKVGYDGQPVYAILSDYVSPGDEVAFERGDGSRDVGKVAEAQDGYVTVETGDGRLNVQPAPFKPGGESRTTTKSAWGALNPDIPFDYLEKADIELPTVCRKCDGTEGRTRMEGAFLCPTCAEKSSADAWEDFDAEEDDYELAKEGDGGDGGDGGDTLTSDTEGAHNPRYSPDDDDEEAAEDLGMAGELGKAFDADIYRVSPGPESDIEAATIGVAVDMPNHDVYVDWKNDEFPDSLDEAHVSIYGSIADLEQATGNDTELVESMDVTEKVQKAREARIEKDGNWVSYVGPDGGEGWLNLQTCEVRYQAERPGEGVEGYEEDPIRDGWDEFDGEPTDLTEGDQVQYEVNGETNVATVDGYSGAGKVMLDDGYYIDPESPDMLDVQAVSYGEESDQNLQLGDLPKDHDEWVYSADGSNLRWENSEGEDLLLEIGDDGWTVTYSDGTGVESLLVDGGDEQETVSTMLDVLDGESPDTGDDADDSFVENYDWQDLEVDDRVTMVDGQSGVVVEPPDGEHDHFTIEDDGETKDFQAWEVEDLVKPDSTMDEEPAIDEVDDPNDTDLEPEQVNQPEVQDDPDTMPDPTGGSWMDHVGDYDVTKFNEDDFDEWGSLSEFGFPSGVSGAHMDVGALPEYDGESNQGLVFRRKFGDGALDPETGHRQMVAYTIGAALGGQMPTHAGHAEEEGQVVANGVDGYDIGSAPDEVLEEVDEDQFIEQAAVQIILGNNDAHMQNVKVTPEGDVVFHDIDHAAGDITSDFVGQKSYYDNSIDRVLGELYRSAQHVVEGEEQDVKQRMLDAATDLAEEHQNTGANAGDDDYETFADCVEEESDKDDPDAFCASIFFGGDGDNELAQALQSAVDHSSELVQNVQNNIQNLAQGNVSW